MDELKGFKFGLPAIVLDFIDTMTGSEFITELKGLLRQTKIRDVMEADKEFEEI